MDPSVILMYVLAFGVIAVGLAGAVIPALPGTPFVFGGLWLIAWLGDYERVGPGWLSALATLLVLSMTLEFIASSIGAKKFGASPHAVIGASVGTFVGLFFGLIGLVIGPFVGAVLGELKSRQSLEQAAISGIGAWVGLLLGVVAKLVIAIIMIAVFLFAYFL